MWLVNSTLLKLLRVAFISKYVFHPEYEQSANSLQNIYIYIYILVKKSLLVPGLATEQNETPFK